MKRARGVTLVELMAVAAVIAIVAALALVGWQRARAAGDADAWANTLGNTITLVRRRATAAGTPYMIEVAPTTMRWCQIDAPTCAADGALACATTSGERAPVAGAPSAAVVDALAAVADVIALDGTYAAPPKTALAGTRALYFGPNGSADLTCSHVLASTPVTASGFSIYVHADGKRRRVVAYGATGRPRIIDNW